MSELRIAMFMPGLRPQTLGWAVHRDFAAAVSALGPRFSLLTTGVPPAEGDSDVQVLPTPRGWTALAEPAAVVLRTRSLLPAAAALASYLRRAGDDVDLLHVEVAYPHGTAALLGCRLAGWRRPVVVTPMGEDTLVVPRASYGFRRYRWPRWLLAWTLRRATLVRCISPLIERRITAIAPDARRLSLPLSVSKATVSRARDPHEVRRRRRRVARAALDERCGTAGRPVVLALGRQHPFKGLDVLVRALPTLPDAVLVVAGPSLRIEPGGDVEGSLRRLAASLGVEDRVRWPGAVPADESLDWLAAADVVAVPSYLESLNKVCVEAAAVGTPFVVTETTGIAEWVPEEGAGVGLVVSADDPTALSEALARVVSGRWRPDEARLSEFVRPFEPEVVAGTLVGAYRELVAGGR